MLDKNDSARDCRVLVTLSGQPSERELMSHFAAVAQEVHRAGGHVDVLIDISDVGHMPVETPTLAIRAGFLNDPNTRNVIVVGMNKWAQILAQVASRASGKPIMFYRTMADADHALACADSVSVW